MQYFIVGLGNPGDEYFESRHNTGRMAVEAFRKKLDFPFWNEDKKKNVAVSKGVLGATKVLLIRPETFMNKSGLPLPFFIKSKKATESLVVAYDDIDLPLGTLKISWNRGAGGHRGLESIVRTLKTKEFIRLRIGVSPQTPSGKLRKPKGEERVVKFILGKFTKDETMILKKIFKLSCEALETIVVYGKDHAMGKYN